MKITMQDFEEFEKRYMFEVLKNPDYRIGQAFYNTFPEIALSMEDDGDIGYSEASRLWNSKNLGEVLELIDWYLIK